jgi:hypothetical protein
VIYLAERLHEELDIVLGNARRDAGHTPEPTIVFLTIVTEGSPRPNLLPIKSGTDGG